jgi:uncharacterized protein YbjQ (UPF0145 family)
MQATDPDVLISTTDEVPGFKTRKYIGIVWASSARSLDSFSEIGAMVRSIGGGDLPAFRKLLNEGRHAVLHELAGIAKARGANAIVGVRLESASIVGGTLDVYAYGTAVVVEKESARGK